MIDQLIKEIDLYYSSGNDVPVERASIPADKWQALKAEIEKLKDVAEDLRDELIEMMDRADS